MTSGPSRRATLLTGLAALLPDIALGATATPVDRDAALAAARRRPASLAGKAARNGRLFGTSLNVWDMGDAAYLGAIARECSLLVAENALKANQYRASPLGFDFTGAEKVHDFAHRNGMAFRGHTLAWFNSIPKWVLDTVTTPEQAREELYLEVREPCRHFAGRVHSWDVVNEVLRPEDGQPLGMRHSFWQQMIGPDFVDMAFFAAKRADPAALLCLNEMDIEYDHPYFDTKRQALLAFLKRLIGNGVPIDAIGIQSHMQYVNIGKFPFSKRVFRDFLSSIADLGLKVIISELDVPDRNLPADIGQRDRIVAQSVGDLVSAAVDHPSVLGVVTWGLSDRYSWMNADPTFRRSDGLRSRGTLLDDRLMPTPAYRAVAAAFDTATVTDTRGVG